MEKEKVVILGGGRSGRGAEKLCLSLSVKTQVYEDCLSEEEKRKILHGSYDECVISPGFPVESQALKTLLRNNPKMKITGEIQFAGRYFTGKVFAIGGTNGKTTAVSLLTHILGGFTYAKSAGNIGFPFSLLASECVENQGKSGYLPPVALLELSSFQTERLGDFSCDGACVLNITPDHLDIHKTFENYKRVKNSLYERIKSDGFAVINADDPNISQSFCGEKVFYSTEKSADCEVCGEYIVCKGRRIIKTEEIKLKGKHNLGNVLATVCFACNIGVPSDIIASKISSFTGLPHRLELVCEKDGTRFYDDSKATNPDSVLKAVACFNPKDTAIIMGGSKKSADFKAFFNNLPSQKLIVFTGETAEEMMETAKEVYFGKDVRLVFAGDMEEATEKAFASGAKTVLLSPACASFDRYSGYEERGDHFRSCVNALCKSSLRRNSQEPSEPAETPPKNHENPPKDHEKPPSNHEKPPKNAKFLIGNPSKTAENLPENHSERAEKTFSEEGESS